VALSFSTIVPTAGNNVVADTINDTLTLTSSGNSIIITGTGATDTLNFETNFAGSSPTWAQVLASGNSSGGTEAIISAGDFLRLEDNTLLTFGSDDDGVIQYDETTDNRVEVTGASWMFDTDIRMGLTTGGSVRDILFSNAGSDSGRCKFQGGSAQFHIWVEALNGDVWRFEAVNATSPEFVFQNFGVGTLTKFRIISDDLHIGTAAVIDPVITFDSTTDGTIRWDTSEDEFVINGGFRTTAGMFIVEDFTVAGFVKNDASGVFSGGNSIDISDDTNLSATSPIVLTGDVLSWDFSVANTWTGEQTFDAGIQLNDNDIISLGTGDDASIVSDGTDLTFDTTGVLNFGTNMQLTDATADVDFDPDNIFETLGSFDRVHLTCSFDTAGGAAEASLGFVTRAGGNVNNMYGAFGFSSTSGTFSHSQGVRGVAGLFNIATDWTGTANHFTAVLGQALIRANNTTIAAVCSCYRAQASILINTDVTDFRMFYYVNPSVPGGVNAGNITTCYGYHAFEITDTEIQNAFEFFNEGAGGHYFRDAAINISSQTDGHMDLAADISIDLNSTIVISGDIDHDGSNVGFFGTAPAAQPAAYTPTNVSTDRSYDANATTLDEISDVLGTLIADLQSLGLIG